MHNALNILNLEIEKPNSSKLTCKYNAKVIVSNFI